MFKSPNLAKTGMKMNFDKRDRIQENQGTWPDNFGNTRELT